MAALLGVLLLLMVAVVVAAPELIGFDLRSWLTRRLRGVSEESGARAGDDSRRETSDAS